MTPGERGRGEGVGRIKILDFGLARFALESAAPGALLASPTADTAPALDAKDTPSGSLTQTGTVMGTPDYIAPEQARDAHAADIRADIYSLGCTLYDLLTGKPPFPEGTMVQKVIAHLERTPRPVHQLRPEVPAGLAKVIDRMLAKDPAQRYQTPAEVAQALEPFIAPAPKKPRRSLVLAAVLGFFAIVLAGIVIYIQTDRGEFVIEAADKDVALIVNAMGVKIRDPNTNREYLLKVGKHDIRSGEYEIDVSEIPGGLEVSTRRFTLTRGDQKWVTVYLKKSIKAPTEPQTDHARLHGIWKTERAQVMGKQVSDRVIKAFEPSLTFTGDRVTWKVNNVTWHDDPQLEGMLAPLRLFQGAFTINPSREPKTVDLETKEPKVLGIYKLEGETLTLCYSSDPDRKGERPTDFKAGADVSLVVLRRVQTPKEERVAAFAPPEQPITREGVTPAESGWRIDAKGKKDPHKEPFEFFEVGLPGLDNCKLTLRAKLKSVGLKGKAYLQLMCRSEGVDSFSKYGMLNPLKGDSDWRVDQTPFFLQKGQRVQLAKVQVVVEGHGTVYIKDIELIKAPLADGEIWPPPGKEVGQGPATDREIRIAPFNSSEKPITKEGVRWDKDILQIESTEKRTVKLLDWETAPMDNCRILLRGKVKTANLDKGGWLELRGRVAFAGRNDLWFSNNNILGRNSDWQSWEIPWRLHKDERLQQIQMNVKLDGSGTVWLKDVELVRAPFAELGAPDRKAQNKTEGKTGVFDK